MKYASPPNLNYYPESELFKQLPTPSTVERDSVSHVLDAEWYVNPRMLVCLDIERGIVTWAALVGTESSCGSFDLGDPIPQGLRDAIQAVVAAKETL